MTIQTDTHTPRTSYDNVTVTTAAVTATVSDGKERGTAALAYTISSDETTNEEARSGSDPNTGHIEEAVLIQHGVVTSKQAQLLAAQRALEHVIRLGADTVTITVESPEELPPTEIESNMDRDFNAYEQTVFDLFDHIPVVNVEKTAATGNPADTIVKSRFEQL